MITFYLYGLLAVTIMMIIVWIISVIIKNASIVDIFWGMTFILMNVVYLVRSGDQNMRQLVVMCLVAIWGLRLTIYVAVRNAGKGEDFRYRQFRENYGAERYWWVSLFQVFLLQASLS